MYRKFYLNGKSLGLFFTVLILLMSFIFSFTMNVKAESRTEIYDQASVSADSSDILTVKSGSEFNVSIVDEKLVYDNKGSILNNSDTEVSREVNGNASITYFVKFTNKENAFLKAELYGRDRQVEASTNGSAFSVLKEVYTCNSIYYYTLTDMLAQDNTVYIRFSDSSPKDDNGCRLRSLSFLDDYDIQRAKEQNFTNNMTLEINLTDETLFANNGSVLNRSTDGEVYRSFKGVQSFVYPIKIPANTSKAYLVAEIIGSNKKVQVSKDGQTFTDLIYEGKNSFDGATYKEENYHFISLEDYCDDLTKETTIYLRFMTYSTEDMSEVMVRNLLLVCKKLQPEISSLPQDKKIEKYTMHVGSKEEQNSAVPELSYGIKHLDIYGRFFCDRYGTMVYRFECDAATEKVYFAINLMSGYLISVSEDGNIWTDIDIADLNNNCSLGYNLNHETYYYDVSDYLSDSNEIYLKFSDPIKFNGYGAIYDKFEMITVLGEEKELTNEIFATGKLNTKINLYDDSLLASNAGSIAYVNARVLPNKGSFAYKFVLPKDAYNFSIYYRARGNARVKVSSNGKEYSTIPSEYYFGFEDKESNAWVTYDLSFMLKNSKEIYVQFENLRDQDAFILQSLYAAYNRQGSALQNYDTVQRQGFVVGTSTELDYLYKSEDAFNEVGVAYRIIRKSAYRIYKFKYADTTKALTLYGQFSGSYAVAVSSDGKNFVDVAVAKKLDFPDVDLVLNATFIEKDISQFMNDSHEIYVKVYSSCDEVYFGAAVSGMGIKELSGEKIIVQDTNGGCAGTIDSIGMISIPFLGLGIVFLTFRLIVVKRNNKIK